MNTPAPHQAPPRVNGHSAPLDDINRQGQRIQEFIEKIHALPDAAARAVVHECMTSLLTFYGYGLERVLQVVKRAGISGQKIHDELLQDRFISGLLLVHGLHPIDLETRLREALHKIRCKIDGNTYAYRDRCPACNLPLHLGTLDGGIFACRAGHRFSLQDAGRSPDDWHLHLDPVPLISKDGAVQVALTPEHDEAAVAEK